MGPNGCTDGKALLALMLAAPLYNNPTCPVMFLLN